MIHGLPAVFACVDYGSITIGESFAGGDFFGFEQEVAEEGVIFGGCVGQAWNVLFGDN